MDLYGSVPVLYGHSTQRTGGVFWHNAAETWMDIYTAESNVVLSIFNFLSGSRKSDPPAAHFMSEPGIIDTFILLGPTPLDVFKQYTWLTGTTPLPQMFALGYHQCRWNYNDERDVEDVSAKFDEYDFFNAEVREYYASQYELKNFKTVTSDVMFWNDMNEPSVFNGPEVTILKCWL